MRETTPKPPSLGNDPTPDLRSEGEEVPAKEAPANEPKGDEADTPTSSPPPSSTKLSLKWDGLLVTALALFFLVRFAELPLAHRTFFGRDYSWSFVPQKAYVAEALAQGRLPLWSPELYSGHPILADLSTGVLYPLNVLLLVPLSLRARVDLFFAFHYLLAAVGIFFLLRYWRRSRPAALAGGLAFSLSGYAVSMAWTPFYLLSLAWLPVVLLFGTQMLERPSLRTVSWTVLAASIQFLTGEPQGCLFSALLLFLFFLFRFGEKRFRKNPKQVARVVGGAGLALVLTAGLVGPQLFPSAELASRSMRSESLTLDEAQGRFYVAPHRLLGLPLKQPFGDPSCHEGGAWRPVSASRKSTGDEDTGGAGAGSGTWAMSLYLGIAALFAAAAALVDRGQRRRVGWILAGGGLALLAALGPSTPVFHGMFRLMPWFRYPAKYMGLVGLCVALLVGLGADVLVELPVKHPKGAAIAAGGTHVFFALGAVTASWIGSLLLPANPGAATETLRGAFLNGWALVTVLTLLGGLRARKRLSKRLASWVFVALVILDLLFAHLPLCDTAPREDFEKKPRLLQVLERAGETPRAGRHRLYRVRLAGKAGQPLARHSPQKATALRRESLAPDIGMNWGVLYVEGYLSSSLAVNQRLWDGVVRTGRPLALLRLMGVRYLVLPLGAPVPPRGSGIKRLQVLPKLGVQVLINESALPRAFVVHHARTLSDGEILRRLTTSGFDPGSVVFLTGEVPDPHQRRKTSVKPAGEGCSLKENSPERVVLSCRLQEPGWVVLSDTFFPGWHAQVNGKKTKIHRAYLQMRAVQAPKGTNRVVFEYRPKSWTLGKVSALISFLVIVSLLGVSYLPPWSEKRKGRRRGGHPKDSNAPPA